MKKTLYGLVCLAVLCAGVAQAEKENGKGKKKRLEGQTVITANRLDYNYKSSVAVFEGNVVVKDPEIYMTADKMSITLDRTNNVIKQVVALGNVHVTYEDKVATGKNAVYNAIKGEVELRGDAQVMRGQDIVKGERIVFLIHEQKMEVEPGTVVMSPKTRADGSVDNLFKLDGSIDKQDGVKKGE